MIFIWAGNGNILFSVVLFVLLNTTDVITNILPHLIKLAIIFFCFYQAFPQQAERLIRIFSSGANINFHHEWSFNFGGDDQRNNLARTEEARNTVHGLPTEFYGIHTDTQEDFDNRSVKELREFAKRRGIDTSSILEKRELVAKLVEHDRDLQCCICLEEFEPGVSMRFLQCHHIFHDGCIDQWLKSAPELSNRKVACPYCNTPVTTS